jgi:hypothetical protein
LTACDSNDRSAPLITLPAVARPLTGAIPESINATPTPTPVILRPATSILAQPSTAPADRATNDIGLRPCSAIQSLPLSRTGALGVTAATPAEARIAAIPARGTRAVMARTAFSRRTTAPPARATARSAAGALSYRTITSTRGPSAPAEAAPGAANSAATVPSVAKTAVVRTLNRILTLLGHLVMPWCGRP